MLTGIGGAFSGKLSVNGGSCAGWEALFGRNPPCRGARDYADVPCSERAISPPDESATAQEA